MEIGLFQPIDTKKLSRAQTYLFRNHIDYTNLSNIEVIKLANRTANWDSFCAQFSGFIYSVSEETDKCIIETEKERHYILLGTDEELMEFDPLSKLHAFYKIEKTRVLTEEEKVKAKNRIKQKKKIIYN